MAQETKTVSIRLTQEVMDELANYGDSVTEQVRNAVLEGKRRKTIAANELRGAFTPNEWQWIAASLNGTMITDDIRYDKQAFIWNCEDYAKYENVEASQWPDVTVATIAEKVANISGLHVAAIYDRVEDFWRHPEYDLQKWSEY